MAVDSPRHSHPDSLLCGNCGHVEPLHINSMCGIAGCYCRGFVDPETDESASVRVQADDAPLALELGVAGARRDRPSGVGLEPLPALPVNDGLRVHGWEQLWDSAGEPVSGGVAGPVVVDAVRAGALADRLRGGAIRVAVEGARVQEGERMVLSGSPTAAVSEREPHAAVAPGSFVATHLQERTASAPPARTGKASSRSETAVSSTRISIDERRL